MIGWLAADTSAGKVWWRRHRSVAMKRAPLISSGVSSGRMVKRTYSSRRATGSSMSRPLASITAA